MAPYNYNNYYDPVNSQPSHPQGYTYANDQQHPPPPPPQQHASSSTPQYQSQSSSGYQTNYQQSYNTPYATQSYASTGQQHQQASSGASRAVSALNSLNNTQGCGRSASDVRSANVATQYDNAYYGSSGFSPMNDRNQTNNSPLYATNLSGSTFGRLSVSDQPQSSSSTFANTHGYQQSLLNASTSRSYQNAPPSATRELEPYQNAYNPQQGQQQPPRYSHPVHAVKAQETHNKQSSQSSTHAPSPQMAVRHSQQQAQQHRQQSASVEPSPTTVDPSQVYDMRAEQQRKAQTEAERRRKFEAARKAEEVARAAEEAARKAEEDKKVEVERENCEAEEAARRRIDDMEKKKAAQERKNEQRRNAREEKRQSKTAATALTQMAAGAGLTSGMAEMPSMMGETSAPPANDEEAEMRAMFTKMREFNARNPAMLAKLWEEERRQHTAQTVSPLPTKLTTPAPPSQQQQNELASAAGGVSPTPAPSQQARQQYKPKPTPATQPPPQPVVQPASTALWPPHKKGSLAEAAANWLNNLPENSSFGRTIGKEAILKILDTNPSYVQLCELIEKTQIRFERSALAKELLKAVPDGLRSGQAGVKQTTPSTPLTEAALNVNGVSTSADAGIAKNKTGRPKKDGPPSYSVPPPNRSDIGPVSYQAPTFHSIPGVARDVNSISKALVSPQRMGTVAAAITTDTPVQQPRQSPHFAEDVRNAIDSRPALQEQLEVKPEPPAQPVEPSRPPADKEEAARKRTFGDLVDLTKDDDSDDDGPPRKLLQPSGGPMTGAIKHLPPNDQFVSPVDYNTFMRQNAVNGLIPGQGGMQPSAPVPYPWSAALGSNQKSPALMVPSQPPPRPKGPTEEQKQHDRMRGKMLVEPIMRDRVARKSKYDTRTIARDVLLATGRHPDMRALNAHLNPMQKLLGDHGGAVDGAGNKSDLSTIRWDIIDPAESVHHTGAKSKPGAVAIVEDADNADATEDEPMLEARTFPEQSNSTPPDTSEEKMRQLKEVAKPGEWERFSEESMRRKLINRLHQRLWKERHTAKKKALTSAADSEGDRSTNIAHLTQDSGDDSAVGRGNETGGSSGAKPRRGRPPKYPNFASPAKNNDNNNAVQTTPGSTPSHRATPKMANGSAVGYAAFRQYDEHGNVIKKKGRPIGWRKNIHSREAAGLTPVKAGGSATKPSASRLRQSTGFADRDDLVKPSYQIYKCRWRNCTAELDNLERLKKHVLKLHGTADDDNVFECCWLPCKFHGKHMDASGNTVAGESSTMTFERLEHWMNHVNREHLEEVAWELGDGPKGGMVTEYHTDSEAYLSDSFGRSVTPVIVPPAEMREADQNKSAEPGLPSDIPQTKRVGRPPKVPVYRSDGTAMTKEEQDAAADLDKLRGQKLHEGVSMGREGSRLATEKRRLGFLDDEDFEDLIYDSD